MTTWEKARRREGDSEGVGECRKSLEINDPNSWCILPVHVQVADNGGMKKRF